MGSPLVAASSYLGTVFLVLLGAAITLVTSIIVEERKVRRDAAREAEQRARHLQTAARLVREEIMAASDQLRIADVFNRWWAVDVVLPTREWDEHRATLAEGITDSMQWYCVTDAYSNVRYMNQLRAELPAGAQDVSSDDCQRLQGARAKLEAAQRDLSEHAEGPSGRRTTA